MTAPIPSATMDRISVAAAGIVEAIGSDGFFAKIAEMLEQCIPYEALIVFLYRENSAPIMLDCFKDARNFQTGLENYLRYTYVINPVYRAYLEGIVPNTYLIAELLSPRHTDQIATSGLDIRVEDNEAIGYRTPGWPKNKTEILTLIGLPENKLIELNFMTAQTGGGTAQCHAFLKSIFPVLSSAVVKHFEFFGDNIEVSSANPSQEYWFQSFGEDILTTRERSVVKMILTGYSSNAIALRLEISLPTVKSHRRNIYAKLQISSQAELFSLFVQKMMKNA